MKLLYITNGITGSGGLERVLSVKASLLADDFNYEVHILTLNEMDKEPFYSFSKNVNLHSVKVSGNSYQCFLQYKKGIQRIVDDLQPDIILVCDDGLKGFLIPRLIKTNAKLIYERHASIHFNTTARFKGKLIQKVMHWSSSKFDRFVVLTTTNIREWEGNNIIAIPNPLSFKSTNKSTLENKNVIAVGSHSYNKGYDLLLQAWKTIEKSHPDWKLTVYGKIDNARTFVNLAQQYQLNSVIFHAPVQNIREKYLESSIMVLPSRTEGFGMVLTEAMECGLPCVSFDCPSGPADIINDLEDGFLVERENTKQLTVRLQQLMGDEHLRKAMGKNAERNVKRFAPEIITAQWDQLFKELSK